MYFDPHVRNLPFKPLTFALGPNISVRIHSQEHMYITFAHRQNSVRFSVGSKLKVGDDKCKCCVRFVLYMKKYKSPHVRLYAANYSVCTGIISGNVLFFFQRSSCIQSAMTSQGKMFWRDTSKRRARRFTLCLARCRPACPSITVSLPRRSSLADKWKRRSHPKR